MLLVGCGALGSVIAESLTRAGIGLLKIVDRDFVDLSNLQRQVLFDEADVAAHRPKAIAAAETARLGLGNLSKLCPGGGTRCRTPFPSHPHPGEIMGDPFFHPVSGFDLPRFAGVATFMRLPHVPLEDPRIADVAIGLIRAVTGLSARRKAAATDLPPKLINAHTGGRND